MFESERARLAEVSTQAASASGSAFGLGDQVNVKQQNFAWLTASKVSHHHKTPGPIKVIALPELQETIQPTNPHHHQRRIHCHAFPVNPHDGNQKPPPPSIWSQLLTPISNYILANPGTTALRILSLTAYFFPFTAWMPACLSVVFSALGPAAGWVAPAFQSVFGTPGVFRTAQSAVMDGWGAPVLDGAVRGVALILGGGRRGVSMDEAGIVEAMSSG